MQGRFNIQKPINVRNNSNKIKEKKHATMTNELEKAFDEIKYFSMIKTLKKLGIEGNFLSLIKSISDKITADIMLNDGSLNAFPQIRKMSTQTMADGFSHRI